MALLDVGEYMINNRANLGQGVPSGVEPALAYQQLSISGSSVQSAAFNAGTRIVRLHADAPCRVAFGTNPTASVGASLRLNAGATEYFNVQPGHKVAVITST